MFAPSAMLGFLSVRRFPLGLSIYKNKRVGVLAQGGNDAQLFSGADCAAKQIAFKVGVAPLLPLTPLRPLDCSTFVPGAGRFTAVPWANGSIRVATPSQAVEILGISRLLGAGGSLKAAAHSRAYTIQSAGAGCQLSELQKALVPGTWLFP